MIEILPVLAALGVAVVQAVFSLGFIFWGRWVAQRHPTAAWRHASRMPAVALLLAALQYAMSGYLIVRGFSRVATVMPEEKARFLAESISEAMNWGAILGLPSFLLYVASLVAFTIGSILKPREARAW
jgi:hypothetical protein